MTSRTSSGSDATVGPVGRRQFVASRDPLEAPAGFLHHPLSWGHLYTCPTLPMVRARGPEGQDRVLLGTAYAERPTVQQDLESAPSAALGGAYRRWSGRWVLLDGPEVHLDASGGLSVFWTERGVASIPALLPGVPEPRRTYAREHVLPYMPGPTTGIPGLARLLPSQTYSVLTGALSSRALISPQVVEPEAAPALLNQLGDLLLESVRGAAELGPVWVPLTAGYDSRLVLAAGVHLGVEMRTVTQIHSGMERSDRELPPLMAERLQLEHVKVPARKWDKSLAEMYDRQVWGLIRETDRVFLARGQFGWLKPGDVLLRGIMLDDTREGFNEAFAGLELDARQIGRAVDADADQREGLAHWVDWVRQDPQPISLHDRYCLEQTSCCYAATTELALDLLGAHSTLPGNSMAYLEAALSLPLEWRMASRHHTDLVARWAPQIADVPYNPPATKIDKMRRVGGAVRRRVRAAAVRFAR